MGWLPPVKIWLFGARFMGPATTTQAFINAISPAKGLKTQKRFTPAPKSEKGGMWQKCYRIELGFRLINYYGQYDFWGKIMKKILFAGLGFAVLGAASSAVAADLPMKAPPMAAVVYTWTGWYVGGNVGYGGSNDPASEYVVSGAAFPIIGAGTPLYGSPNAFRVRDEGVVGGAQVGYNWQTSTNVVLGVEADIQGSDLKGTIGCVLICGVNQITIPRFTAFPVVFGSDSFREKLDWFGTVRGRVGYTSGPTMVYLTGGLAYGDVERSGNVAGITLNPNGSTRNAFTGSYNNSTTKVGWTVGIGGEGKLTAHPGWSVKGEYLYVDLGSNSDTFNTNFLPGGNPGAGVAATRTDTSTNREHIFRLGLNYSFNPTVVAKY
jgi:outer membrane immunogenic protein